MHMLFGKGLELCIKKITVELDCDHLIVHISLKFLYEMGFNGQVDGCQHGVDFEKVHTRYFVAKKICRL